MRIKWLVVFFILLACNSRKQEKTTNTPGDSLSQGNNEITTDKPPHTFWDSISMGLKLSHEQIERYTSIYSHWGMDSFYIASYDTVEFNFKETLGFR
jgi:hypothetical protein